LARRADSATRTNRAAAEAAKTVTAQPAGLTPAEMLDLYRIMYTSRQVDEREILLKRQNKTFFQINGVGHEAVLAAAAKVLRAGYDWFYPYYRDRALCLGLGMTPYEMFLSSVGAADEPELGRATDAVALGAQGAHIVSQSSPTGTQCLQAVGCAEAAVRYALLPEIASAPPSSARTRSPMSPSARERRARVSSGSRSTRRAT